MLILIITVPRASTKLDDVGIFKASAEVFRVLLDDDHTLKCLIKTFNVFAFVNLGFILLCALQALLEHGAVKAWLIILTPVMIYVIYPKLFSKKDMHVLSDPAEIYAVAKSYASVRCVANYKRASALLKKIPD